MNQAIHRIQHVHLSDLRSSEILHPDASVSISAALVGALLLGGISMMAFAPIGWTVAIGLIGAALGFFAAGLENEEESETLGLVEPAEASAL
jgi:hypothetical protein